MILRTFARGVAAIGLIGSLALIGCLDARAATIVVNTTSDQFGTGTECALREAVQAANSDAAFGGCAAGAGGDIIILPANRLDYQITGARDEEANATGDLDVTSVIVLLSIADGSGELSPEMVRIACTDRCFDVKNNGSLSMLSGTLSGGDVTGTAAPNGGLIRRTGTGVLRLVRVALHNGTAQSGGAIYESGSGDSELTNVSMYDNTATATGGAYSNLGTNEARFSNVTVSGNRSLGSGGGLYVRGFTRLKNVTITRNIAVSGGGGMQYDGADTTTVNLANTVIADNYADTPTGRDLNCFTGHIGARAYVLIESLSCSFASSAGPALSADPRLSSLFDFGGGLPSHAILDGSPLLGAGNPDTSNVDTACSSADQRGVTRAGVACDIGAFEREITYTVNTTGDLPDASPGNGVCLASNGLCTLRAAVMEAAASAGASIVRVPAGTYVVTSAQPYLAALGVDPTGPASIMILGETNAPGSVVIDANQSGRVFELLGPASPLESTRSYALFGVTVRNGLLIPTSNNPRPQVGGGIDARHANVYLYKTIVRDNEMRDGRGGGVGVENDAVSGDLFFRPFDVLIENSAIIDNRAPRTTTSTVNGYGGGLAVSTLGQANVGRTRVLNSTIAGNVADQFGGGVYGNARVVFTTVVSNQARFGGGGAYDSVRFGNSILANNTLTQPTAPFDGPDCSGSNLQSLGYNLIANSAACSRSGDPGTDLIDVAATLGARDETSQRAAAYLPQAGSAALDAVPSARCIDYISGARITHDQRDTARSTAAAPTCDIGAIEIITVADPLFANGFE